MLATALGLLPTQVINVYLGSTLRSMQDVLTDDNTATTGYIVFSIQVTSSSSAVLNVKSLIETIGIVGCHKYRIDDLRCTAGSSGISQHRFIDIAQFTQS